MCINKEGGKAGERELIGMEGGREEGKEGVGGEREGGRESEWRKGMEERIWREEGEGRKGE